MADDEPADTTTSGQLKRGRTMAIASTIRKVTSSTSNSFTKKKKAGESEDEEEVDLSRPLVHGAVRFPGSRHRPAKWSQISHEASMYDTMQLLTRTWGLRAPSSLISIIGCRSTSDDLFGPGLKRAATTTNAWILTDGVHEGIGGLVGRLGRVHITTRYTATRS